MGVLFFFAILIILAIYGSINYYIGLKGWELISSLLPFVSSKIYWPIFWLIALSYIIVRFLSRFMPSAISYFLTLIGSYWLGAMIYLSMIILIIRIITFLDRLLSFIPAQLKTTSVSNIISICVILIVAALLVSGVRSANNPTTVKYDVTINKDAGTIKTLHAIAVSDIHLGTLVRKNHLDKMVQMINAKKPDIVFIAGDLIDEDIGPFLKQNMSESLRKLNSKYGVYFCPGNHEYYGGHIDEIIKKLDESGVKVLKDQYTRIGNSFYVVGRDDISSKSYQKSPRKSLSQLTSGLDKSLPILLLDHQPSNLKEPQSNGIDLQISGHTHRGQMFPFNYITHAIFEKDWGYLKKGDFQLIVSSGFGTWGPPIRVFNPSEMVEIFIHFNI